MVTAKTGRLDFENPNDTAGTAADNNYQITVVYTASDNKTYTETVNIEVTDDALTDLGTVAVSSNRTSSGRSAIQLSQNDTSSNLDFGSALDRDMLSQGAKDFIARHGGLDAAGEVFGHLAVASETMTGAATAQASINSTNVHGIAQTTTAADDLFRLCPLGPPNWSW